MAGVFQLTVRYRVHTLPVTQYHHNHNATPWAELSDQLPYLAKENGTHIVPVGLDHGRQFHSGNLSVSLLIAGRGTAWKATTRRSASALEAFRSTAVRRQDKYSYTQVKSRLMRIGFSASSTRNKPAYDSIAIPRRGSRAGCGELAPAVSAATATKSATSNYISAATHPPRFLAALAVTSSGAAA